MFCMSHDAYVTLRMTVEHELLLEIYITSGSQWREIVFERSSVITFILYCNLDTNGAN